MPTPGSEESTTTNAAPEVSTQTAEAVDTAADTDLEADAVSEAGLNFGETDGLPAAESDTTDEPITTSEAGESASPEAALDDTQTPAERRASFLAEIRGETPAKSAVTTDGKPTGDSTDAGNTATEAAAQAADEIGDIDADAIVAEFTEQLGDDTAKKIQPLVKLVKSMASTIRGYEKERADHREQATARQIHELIDSALDDLPGLEKHVGTVKTMTKETAQARGELIETARYVQQRSIKAGKPIDDRAALKRAAVMLEMADAPGTPKGAAKTAAAPAKRPQAKTINPTGSRAPALAKHEPEAPWAGGDDFLSDIQRDIDSKFAD